jgi:hypothetical protein
METVQYGIESKRILYIIYNIYTYYIFIYSHTTYIWNVEFVRQVGTGWLSNVSTSKVTYCTLYLIGVPWEERT